MDGLAPVAVLINWKLINCPGKLESMALNALIVIDDRLGLRLLHVGSGCLQTRRPRDDADTEEKALI